MTEPENFSKPEWIQATLQRVLGQVHGLQATEQAEDTKRPIGAAQLKAIGLSLRHIRFLQGTNLVKKATALREATQFYANASCWCLSLLGGPGTGKTFAAEWFILESLGSNLSDRDTCRRIVSPYELRDAAYDSAKRERLQSLQALVLDDLGCEGEDRTGVFRWVLSEVLNGRWRREKKTVITSNLSGHQFKCRYGALVTDRLTHGGRCVAIHGENLRA